MKKNIISKTALFTLGFVIGVSVIIFALLSLAMPGVMAGWCEATGNYSLAAGYASLHYTYTGEVEEAARCAQDSILAGKNDKIIKYGVQLIDHADFGSYCESRDNYYAQTYNISYSYRQYIYGEISVAYYNKGDTQSAIGCAIQALDSSYDRSSYGTDTNSVYLIEGFADNNALITLSLEVIDKSDDGAAAYIYEILEDITAEGEEQVKLTQFTAIIKAVADGTY